MEEGRKEGGGREIERGEGEKMKRKERCKSARMQRGGKEG